MYLLPAGAKPRTKNKWGLGYSLIRDFSTNGGSYPIRSAVPPAPTVFSAPAPTPAPVYSPPTPPPAPVPAAMCQPSAPPPFASGKWDFASCSWIQTQQATAPPAVAPIPIRTYPTAVPSIISRIFNFGLPDVRIAPNIDDGAIVPSPAPAAAASSPSTAGTPVPPNYPVIRSYVASDGSVWQFNAAQNQWVNVSAPSPAAAAAPAAPPAPVSIAVTSAPAASPYQSILDWLTQSTLISPVPNWIVGGGLALLVFGMRSRGGR